ncbi:hypothetical protein [Neobacillus ginsengisoli]|uniref:Uncharacterized protein n=1 Tax=Neobacillus ginsengisoli TaxID=904295 RepID=A0ABT9XYS1_9BACI|nr:hypothetical protein [Neobacillus ginsengisoli]MDQ0200415.1 hypothetical protein [Neobacillus ginsengisoli]
MLNHDSGEDVNVLHAELIDKECIQVQVQINDKVETVWLNYWEPVIVPKSYSPYRLEILVELSNYIEMKEKPFRNEFEFMRMRVLTFG